jgi:glutathione S-transferase
MKLLASLTSPFARKVRVVLAEKHIECELEVVNAWDAVNPVIAHNPLSQVPTLVMDDESSVFDSRVIVEYLDAMSPANRLIPEPGRQRLLVRRWEALADGISECAVRIFLENKRPAEIRDAAWIAMQRTTIERSLVWVAEEVSDKTWLYGHGLSLADIAIGCTLGYLDLRFPDIAWRETHPNLAEYAEKLFQRPSFTETLPPQ